MCGRLNVTADPLTHFLSQVFGLSLSIRSNPNTSPSQSIVTLTSVETAVIAEHAVWGIQPKWANKLIINAQAETVAIKPTFKQAFASRRCLIPCTGWYEWRAKQRYLFYAADDVPFLMAGILYDHQRTECVSLTTEPKGRAKEIHHRMPQLIRKQDAHAWLDGGIEEASVLLQPSDFARLDYRTYP